MDNVWRLCPHPPLRPPSLPPVPVPISQRAKRDDMACPSQVGTNPAVSVCLHSLSCICMDTGFHLSLSRNLQGFGVLVGASDPGETTKRSTVKRTDIIIMTMVTITGTYAWIAATVRQLLVPPYVQLLQSLNSAGKRCTHVIYFVQNREGGGGMLLSRIKRAVS